MALSRLNEIRSMALFALADQAQEGAAEPDDDAVLALR